MRSLISPLACLLAGLAIAAPTAIARPLDLRSADARHAAMLARAPQDLRSPDTRDAAKAQQQPAATADQTTPALPRTAVHPDRDTPWALIGGLWLASLLVLGGVARRRIARVTA